MIETDFSSYFSFHENLSAHNKKIAEDILEKLIELNSRLTAQIQRHSRLTQPHSSCEEEKKCACKRTDCRDMDETTRESKRIVRPYLLVNSVTWR
jgi:hypothetical protein